MYILKHLKMFLTYFTLTTSNIIPCAFMCDAVWIHIKLQVCVQTSDFEWTFILFWCVIYVLCRNKFCWEHLWASRGKQFTGQSGERIPSLNINDRQSSHVFFFWKWFGVGWGVGGGWESHTDSGCRGWGRGHLPGEMLLLLLLLVVVAWRRRSQ